MAIVLNRLNPGNDKTKIIELLTKQDEASRQIAYHGVTEAIARTYAANADVTIPRASLAIEIQNIVRTIAELVILDTPSFQHMLNAKFNLYYNMYLRTDKRNPYEWNSLEDTFGITQVYSKQDIELVNSKFDLYRQAYVIGHDWYIMEYLAKKQGA